MLARLTSDSVEPEWLTLLRREHDKGRAISEIAREAGIARSSLSHLLSGTYPAQSLDNATRKHGARVTALYRDQLLCPHLGRGISADACRAFASAPMSTSHPDKLRHWRACGRCRFNAVRDMRNA